MPGPVASNETKVPVDFSFLKCLSRSHTCIWFTGYATNPTTISSPRPRISLVLVVPRPEHPVWCLPSEDSGKSNPTHWQRWWILPSNLPPAPCWLEIMSRSLNVFAPLFSHPPNENGNTHVIFLKRLLWELNELMWAKWLEGSQAESKLSSQGMLVLEWLLLIEWTK